MLLMFFVFTSDILCSLEVLLVYDNRQEMGQPQKLV